MRVPIERPILDPVAVAAALVRCPSVTPADGGCLEAVAALLSPMGFRVEAFWAGEGERAVRNLWAVHGGGEPVLAFAGHTDVVPAGGAPWSHPPFAGHLDPTFLWGRGAVDMKGAVAAFLAAADRHLRERCGRPGTLMVLLTGDEEEGGPHGMRAILSRLEGQSVRPSACLVGEPSSEGFFGQGIRIGRRGSLNVEVSSVGVLGHVAWPDRAANALHPLIDYLGELRRWDLGPGEACFPPSSLQITQVTADSPAGNVVPGRASARLNIRFNRRHQGASLVARLRALAEPFGPRLQLCPTISGEPYLAEACPLVDLVAQQVHRVTGQRPERNAGGGVSDGRFLRALCPVVEFGLVGDLAHHVDERVARADLLALADIYAGVLDGFFAPPAPAAPH